MSQFLRPIDLEAEMVRHRRIKRLAPGELQAGQQQFADELEAAQQPRQFVIPGSPSPLDNLPPLPAGSYENAGPMLGGQRDALLEATASPGGIGSGPLGALGRLPGVVAGMALGTQPSAPTAGTPRSDQILPSGQRADYRPGGPEFGERVPPPNAAHQAAPIERPASLSPESPVARINPAQSSLPGAPTLAVPPVVSPDQAAIAAILAALPQPQTTFTSADLPNLPVQTMGTRGGNAVLGIEDRPDRTLPFGMTAREWSSLSPERQAAARASPLGAIPQGPAWATQPGLTDQQRFAMMNAPVTPMQAISQAQMAGVAPQTAIEALLGTQRLGVDQGRLDLARQEAMGVTGDPTRPGSLATAAIQANSPAEVARLHFGPDAQAARLMEELLKGRLNAGLAPDQIAQGLPETINAIRAAVRGQAPPATGNTGGNNTGNTNRTDGTGATGGAPWTQAPRNQVDAQGRVIGVSPYAGMTYPQDFNPAVEFGWSTPGQAVPLPRAIQQIQDLSRRNPEVVSRNWPIIRGLLERGYGQETLNRMLYAPGMSGFSTSQNAIQALDRSQLPADRLRLMQQSITPENDSFLSPNTSETIRRNIAPVTPRGTPPTGNQRGREGFSWWNLF